MNNKGQIYIFAAVIISVILFGLTITYNKIEQKRLSADFNTLSDNYNLESARFLNALIENPSSSDDSLDNRFLRFSTEFSSYARSKDPNYELFYVFAKENKLYLGNFLNKAVFIEGEEDDKLVGCYDKIEANIQLGGLIYPGTVDMSYILNNCGKTYRHNTWSCIAISKQHAG